MNTEATKTASEEVLHHLEKNLFIIQAALEGAQEEMKQAVLAERERCAKIAEQYGQTPNPNWSTPEGVCAHEVTAEVIAQRIREGR